MAYHAVARQQSTCNPYRAPMAWRLPSIGESVISNTQSARSDATTLAGSRSFPTLDQISFAVIAVGLVVRLRQYAANRSLWLDELWLANNIVDRGYAELATPLADAQTAPLGFLWIVKSITLVFGSGEYALRLLPLCAGCLVLPLFFCAFRRRVGAFATLAGLLLIVLEKRMVRWSLELKPYSLDALVSLSLLLCFWIYQERKGDVRSTVALALAGCAALFISYPAAIVLAGGGVLLAARALGRREGKTILRLIGMGTLWSVVFAANYWFLLRHQIPHDIVQTAWKEAFVPVRSGLAEWTSWLLVHSRDVFRTTVKTGLPELSAALFLVGCAVFARRAPAQLLLVLSALPFALVASALRKYPFGGRLFLYFVPQLAIVMGIAIERIYRGHRRWRRALAIALLVACVAENAVQETHAFFTPRLKEESRPVLEQVAEHYRVGDVTYLAFTSEPAFQYYAPRVGLAHAKTTSGGLNRQQVHNDLDSLRGRRVWLFLAHGMTLRGGVDNEAWLLEFADSLGERNHQVIAEGSAAYLYILRD